MYRPEGRPRGPIAAMRHCEVKIQKDTMDKTVLGRSGCLSEKAVKKLAPTRTAMHPVFSPLKIDFHMLVEKQVFSTIQHTQNPSNICS